MTRRFLVLLLAALLAATGCANGTLSEEAAEDLQERADAVRAAAEARDVDAAQEALTGLRAALDAHVEADAVSPGRARDIATAADAVEARLSLLIEEEVEEVPVDEQGPVDEPPTTEPPPPSTTVPEPDPEPEPDDDKDDKDDDKDDEDPGGERQEEEGGGNDRGPDGEGPPGQSRAGSGA